MSMETWSRRDKIEPFPVFKQDMLDCAALLEADGFDVRYAWDEADLSVFQRKREEKR